ncbi:MAG: hypothetical protein KKD77_20325, partial [Gammaproteobacteria bacterium]|nr:hypothetical protein [Gammaproteobacteria bacterium]
GGDILRTTGWQEVLISTNGLLKRVDVYLWHPTVPKTATIRLEISSGGITGTQYSDISYTVGTSRAWYCFDNFNIKLTSGTTYRINVTEGGAQGTVFWSVRNGDTYPGKNSFGSTANDFMFKAYVYPSTPSYTSRIYDVTTGGATFIRWANMAVTESGTGNGTPNFYYVRTSTASATMSTQGWTQMSNNSLVISTQSTFAQYRIISNSSNTINDANVGFFGKGIEYPMHGCVHEDRYYLSVSTDSGSKINNVTLCYQKDGTWTIFNNLYSGPITALNNRIYYGDSRDTGHVFEFDVDGVYTDSGTAYTSRWQSKLFTNDIDNEKIYRSAWITADNQTGANLTVKYDTDYYDSWTTLATVPLTGSGLLVRKYPFRNATKGRQIQVEVTDGADTDYWNLHSLRIMGVLLRNR